MLLICKNTLGFMFKKLEINSDLLPDQSELNTIQGDSFKDSKLSSKWCYSIQKPEGEVGKERSREKKVGERRER